MPERDSLGELVLALAIREDAFGKLVSFGFHPSMLQSSDCTHAWDYCISLKAKGDKPSLEEVSLKFKLGFSIPEGETVESSFRRLRTRSFSFDLKPFIENATSEISRGNPEVALKIILEASKLKGKYAERKAKEILSYKKSFEERILAYTKLKESGGILGAVSRWTTWNKETKGFQDGFFHVIAALTSVGKSWFLMLILEDLLLQKRKPLVVSTEMAPLRLQFRLDCLRYKLPFVGLRDATLPDDVELDWMRKLYEESIDDGVSDAIFVGKKEVNSVSEVELLARDLGCTDILIDGGYRLTTSREWGDQAKLVQDMQCAAEDSHLPWITTVQLGDSSEKGKSFESKFGNKWNIRYAKEWLIDPDVVALLSQDKDLKLINQMLVQMSKIRDGDGKPKSFKIHWDSFAMRYDEVSDEEEEKEALKSLKSLEKSAEF